jgi:hypothetical protein
MPSSAAVKRTMLDGCQTYAPALITYPTASPESEYETPLQTPDISSSSYKIRFDAMMARMARIEARFEATLYQMEKIVRQLQEQMTQKI